MEYNLKRAVAEYNQGARKKDLIKKYKVTRNQLDYKLLKYYQYGEDCVLRAGRKVKFFQEQIEWIVNHMKDNDCAFDLAELKHEFEEHYVNDGLKISLSSLYKILTDHGIKYGRKVKPPVKKFDEERRKIIL